MFCLTSGGKTSKIETKLTCPTSRLLLFSIDSARPVYFQRKLLRSAQSDFFFCPSWIQDSGRIHVVHRGIYKSVQYRYDYEMNVFLMKAAIILEFMYDMTVGYCAVTQEITTMIEAPKVEARK